MKTRMKQRIFLLLLLVFCIASSAQHVLNPVSVKTSIANVVEGEAVISFDINISPGWHVYSVEEMNGPTQASITFETIHGAQLIGNLTPTATPQKQYEEMFSSEVFYFENNVVFQQRVKLLGGHYALSGYLTYGACNNESCTPPTDEEFSFSGDYIVKKETGDSAESHPSVSYNKETDSVPEENAEQDINNVDTPAGTYTFVGTEPREDYASLLWLFALGFAGGLVALFTPCVWPIIPLTVSFFLKRGAGGRKGTQAALLYGVSIIIIYVTLGLAVTAAFGASALNDLSTNAFFNILFFLMLVVFGISFIGGFDLSLPSSWAGKVDSKATQATGFLSIFLMAFTLALVSFSCTGPIIGFLLVEVVTSNIAGPIVGMLGFSLALALPFTLFALFPGWLKSAPKSGSWMQIVKITLGYIELAFSLKFLSVADLTYGWGILPRTLFITVWIVLSIGLIVQLLMQFRNALKLRLTLCILAACFAAYLVPGLWGAPVKAVSAFAPPMPETGRVISDYEEGLALAHKEGKRVFIDFTGYGCVNCRKMEATVFQDPRITETLEKDYIVIRLYVDDKTALDTPVRVEQNGKSRTLRTIGDKWSYLQASRYGTQTQPFYIITDAEGRMLAPARSYDEDAEAFLKWLK